MKISNKYAMLLYLVAFMGVCLLVQHATGAGKVDWSLTNDEASHVVNSLLILDFLKSHWPGSVMQFGMDYYRHYPRVSVGHWPPFYYVVQSGFLAVFGRNGRSLLIFQALAAASTATLAGAVARSRQGLAAGFALGLMILCSPLFMLQMNAIMADIFLGFLILAASLAWADYARTGSWRSSVAFATLASLAILTKGNGFGLALLPPVFCLLKRDFSVFASRKTWLAALIVGLATIPWYALTYKISSEGFVYSWGLNYTRLALVFNASNMVPALGWAGVACFLAGAARIAFAGEGTRDDTLLAALACALAMFAFQAVAPADLQVRYLIPMVAPAAIVAAQGAGWAATLAGRRLAFAARPAAGAAIVAAILLLNAAVLFRLPVLPSFHMETLERAIADSSSRNALVLVSGCARAEGALIAAFAMDDTSQAHYVIRGYKAFASDDFMGTAYKQRFSCPEDLGEWISESGIGWIVVDTSPESMSVVHNRQIMKYLDSHPHGWERRLAVPHRDGETLLYASRAPDPSPQDIQDVLRQVAPKKILGHY